MQKLVAELQKHIKRRIRALGFAFGLIFAFIIVIYGYKVVRA